MFFGSPGTWCFPRNARRLFVAFNLDAGRIVGSWPPSINTTTPEISSGANGGGGGPKGISAGCRCLLVGMRPLFVRTFYNRKTCSQNPLAGEQIWDSSAKRIFLWWRACQDCGRSCLKLAVVLRFQKYGMSLESQRSWNHVRNCTDHKSLKRWNWFQISSCFKMFHNFFLQPFQFLFAKCTL